MRWLFLFVFALNLAYIGWGLNQPPADPYVNIRPLKNVAPIVLLSEVEGDEHSERLSSTSAVPENNKPEKLLPEAGSETVAETLSGAVAETVSEAVSEVATEAEPDAAAKTEPAAGTEAVTAEVLAVTVAKSEPEPEPQPKSQPEKDMPAESGIVQVSQGCYTIGPFRDLDKLRRLTREIKSYVVSADFRGKEEKEQPLYWVYIKPEKSRREAIETGKQLKSRKVKDFYIIREGDKLNGLSLGYFRSKAGATGLVKKVGKLGFDVVLEPVFKTYTVYWLDYRLAEGAKVPKPVLDRYINDSRKNRISLMARDCDA